MRIYVNDVAVRDGFQIEPRFVPTATKVEVINQLSRTGLHKIEVTSFVSPKAVPALADADAVLAGIDRVPGVIYVALVPNLRGVRNAAATARKPDEVNGVVSASETHNIANINRTHEQSLAELPAMVKAAHDAGMKITMSLSTTFGCPFEGRVHEDVVMELVGRFRNLGFDGSLAGLGGCPFAPGATGNICTEDMVNMLEDMGFDTRIDLAKLLAVARRIPAVVGHDTPGQVMKAGQTLELHEPPSSARTP